MIRQVYCNNSGATIEIKPLSVNDCWQGKRFKTPAYKNYERDLGWLLPKIILPEAPYELYFKFGFSSAGSDLDNPVKPLTDIMQKKYGFNDNQVHRLIVEKIKVAKGGEFLQFEIKTFV